jgi:hypothetical protein
VRDALAGKSRDAVERGYGGGYAGDDVDGGMACCELLFLFFLSFFLSWSFGLFLGNGKKETERDWQREGVADMLQAKASSLDAGLNLLSASGTAKKNI